MTLNRSDQLSELLLELNCSHRISAIVCIDKMNVRTVIVEDETSDESSRRDMDPVYKFSSQEFPFEVSSQSLTLLGGSRENLPEFVVEFLVVCVCY